jgi:hypothetical protein
MARRQVCGNDYDAPMEDWPSGEMRAFHWIERVPSADVLSLADRIHPIRSGASLAEDWSAGGWASAEKRALANSPVVRQANGTTPHRGHRHHSSQALRKQRPHREVHGL